MTDFIDYTEIKGETWFNAEDVLLCLGYMKDKRGKVQCLRNNKTNRDRSTVFNLQPRKFQEGKVWWNATTLLRLKDYLRNQPSLKQKFNNWNYMESVRKDSMNSILKLVDKIDSVLEIKSEPQVFTLADNQPIEKGESLDYVEIYKSAGTCKSFWKQLRQLGVDIGTHKKGVSWKTFQELRPDIYKEIEPHFTATTKRLQNSANNHIQSKKTAPENAVYLVSVVNKKGLFGLMKEVENKTFMESQKDEFISYVIDNFGSIENISKFKRDQSIDLI